MEYDYEILQFLLWVTALSFISIFDYIAKKKLGTKSQGYINLRLPKFISLFISSVTAIVGIYILKKGLININSTNYLSVPYFAAVSYFIVTFFREIKQIKHV